MPTTLITTIISIITGGLIAYLIARWQMKKDQIVHYFINSYDIGKGLTDDFPDFALHYGDEVLSNNVMVLQGGFMNTSRNDIGERDKITEIKLVLPKGCVVKAVKVSPSVNGLKANSQINKESSHIIEKKIVNDELCFEIDGIMKSKEWFNYTAIIETPDEKGNLYKQLKLDHRIKDTTIKHLYLGPYYKKKVSSSKAMFIISIICLPLFLSVIILAFLNPKELLSFTNASSNGSGLFTILFVLFALIILSAYFIAVLFENLGRRGRVVNGLMKEQNSSDYGLFESLFI